MKCLSDKMSDEYLELKKMVIEHLVNQLDETDKKELTKEFNLTEEQLDTLTKKMLDKWLSNTDFIIMIATMLGISMPRKNKERKANYIG